MWNNHASGGDNAKPLLLSYDWANNPGFADAKFEIVPLNNCTTLAINPTVTPSTLSTNILGVNDVGKTGLLQGPVANDFPGDPSHLTQIWESPDARTFEKKHGFLYNMRLDFMYDPTLYTSHVLHNCQIFIVKVINFAKKAASSVGAPPFRPGTAGWTVADSFLDVSGDIHGGDLTKNIHYTAGQQDNGSVTLSPKYFNVLHKFNLSSNPRSVNLGALPGNQTMNWSVNIPCGRMRLEAYDERLEESPVIQNPHKWVGLTPNKIDPLKQVHLLVFTNSGSESTFPFGAAKKRPTLAVRKTFTYGTSLT